VPLLIAALKALLNLLQVV